MSNGLPKSLAVAVGYFAIAGLTIAFTRFGGGFATLWMATAYLSAAMATAPRTTWVYMLICCGLASVAATGLFGLGWHAALPLALVNLLEAWIAATLMRKRAASNALDSLAWFGRFSFRVGLIAPAIGASLGAATFALIQGKALGPAWATWYIGHALGGLSFTPLFLLAFKGEFSGRAKASPLRFEAFVLFALFLASAVYTFWQSRWPILFLPFGPLTIICFRHDRALPALSVATLAVVGGALTALGHGPISLTTAGHTAQIQFFQFYLASVVLTILPVTADLRNRRILVKALRESEARLRVMMEHTSDVILHLKPDGTILFASPSASAMSGRNLPTLIGTNALDLISDDWHAYVQACHFEVLANPGEEVRYEYMASIAGGDTRWFETSSRAVLNDAGSVESVISVVRDVNDRKVDEYDLILEVSRDPLTGLANRRAFGRAFESMRGEHELCVAMIDIDFFKAVNDRYGHAGGDCALQTFAEVARRTVRKDDLVARLGGEEFAVLFKGIGSDQATEICERLRLEMAQAVTFYGATPIRFTVSIGVADVTSPDLDHVLARADAALYDAKRDGRDCLKLAA